VFLAILVAVGVTSALGAAAEVMAKDPTKAGATFRDCTTCPKMVVVAKGTFTMGQDKDTENWEDTSELPRHSVSIKDIFAIGVYEVTQAEYRAIMGDNPSYFRLDPVRQVVNTALPVDTVSWDDAMTFIMKLSLKTGKLYRLPSEAEWEYVARAGKQTPWFFDTTIKNPGASCSTHISAVRSLLLGLDKYAWTLCNANHSTHPVGKLLANKFGVYDIYGNVWEWVGDCYGYGYAATPRDGSAHSVSNCTNRALRGGSWDHYPSDARSAARAGYLPTLGFGNVGFRVARVITH
jgi:formylglycine-generating enzyme required for sulfatase activity